MNPTAGELGLTSGWIVAIICAAFSLSTAIIGLLLRMLLKAYAEKVAQAFEAYRVTVELEMKANRDQMGAEQSKLQITLDLLTEERKACVERHTSSTDKLESRVEKSQEKWEIFVKDNATLEATRGRKVEALFGVVDAMKDTVKGLPHSINAKLDELHRAVREELRDDMKKYVRDLLESRGAD